MAVESLFSLSLKLARREEKELSQAIGGNLRKKKNTRGLGKEHTDDLCSQKQRAVSKQLKRSRFKANLKATGLQRPFTTVFSHPPASSSASFARSSKERERANASISLRGASQIRSKRKKKEEISLFAKTPAAPWRLST